jgi:hypothetical protein
MPQLPAEPTQITRILAGMVKKIKNYNPAQHQFHSR